MYRGDLHINKRRCQLPTRRSMIYVLLWHQPRRGARILQCGRPFIPWYMFPIMKTPEKDEHDTLGTHTLYLEGASPNQRDLFHNIFSETQHYTLNNKIKLKQISQLHKPTIK